MAEPDRMAEEPEWLQVYVLVASGPHRAAEWSLRVPPGTTLAQLLSIESLHFDEAGLSLAQPAEWGVWGRRVSPDYRLQHQDRVERYRPLMVDPKQARRERFVKQGRRAAGLFQLKGRG